MQIVQRKKEIYYQRTHSEQGGAIKVQVGVDSHDLTRILHQSGREIKKNCNSLTNNSVLCAQFCEFLNFFVRLFFSLLAL